MDWASWELFLLRGFTALGKLCQTKQKVRGSGLGHYAEGRRDTLFFGIYVTF